MTHIHIGATDAGGQTPCHSFEEWEALLAAMQRGDPEEIIRITTTARPVMIPTASLTPVEPPRMKDTAAAFWAKRGKAPKACGTPVLSVRT